MSSMLVFVATLLLTNNLVSAAGEKRSRQQAPPIREEVNEWKFSEACESACIKDFYHCMECIMEENPHIEAKTSALFHHAAGTGYALGGSKAYGNQFNGLYPAMPFKMPFDIPYICIVICGPVLIPSVPCIACIVANT